VTLWGVDLPVLETEVNDSGESWKILVYLPSDLPAGDAVIRAYFENVSLAEDFLLYRQEPDEPLSPTVYGYDPNEAQADSQIEMILEGNVLPEVGILVRLTIADMDVPFQSYEVIDDQTAAAQVYLPPDLPPGEGRIVFYFENNVTYADIFTVLPREGEPGVPAEPALWSLSPQDGEVDSDIELFLEGENLRGLGELVSVRIGGFSLPGFDYQVDSDSMVIVNAYLPPDTPTGGQTISVEFENAAIREGFYVSEPAGPALPVWVIAMIGIVILGTAVVVGGGILAVRAIRRSRPTRHERDDSDHRRQTDMKFKVETDLGTQTIEPADGSLTIDLDLRFQITPDPGVQEIETGSRGLTED
jgi:hypothetical protein